MSGNCSTSTWTSLIAAHASYSVFSLDNSILLSNSVHCFRNHVQFYLSLKGRPCISFSVTPMFFFFFSMDINTLFLCTSMTEMAFFFSFFSFFTFHCCQIRAYCLFFPLYFSFENECSLWRTCFRDAHPNLSIFCIHASILHKIFHNPF